MKKFTLALSLLAVSAAALAQGDPRRGAPNEPGYTIPGGENRPNRPMESGQSFRGQVQGIDKPGGRITLKHDTIQAFGVPAGTTEYEVKDSSLLENLKVGDQVRFMAVMQRRSLLVTNIGPAN